MTGLPSVACWRQSGPVSPKCLKQKQVSASNQRTHTILGKSPRDLCAVPLADYRLLGVGFPRRPAPLRGKPQASRQAQNLRCLVTATLPTKLGGLLKTPLRWSRIRAAISWPLHHRVAISNHRLVSFTHGQVTFRWRDSADNNKQKLLPLPVDEFLSRFLLHLLPQGLARRRLAKKPKWRIRTKPCGSRCKRKRLKNSSTGRGSNFCLLLSAESRQRKVTWPWVKETSRW